MHRLRRSLSLLLSFVLALCALSPLGGAALAAGEPVPYAEEHGFVFTRETSLTAPAFFYLTKDGEYLPNSSDCKIEPLEDARYTISGLSLSEPDENGLVELRFTLAMDIAFLTTGTGVSSSFHGISPSFFDYYSGYTVPTSYLYSDGDYSYVAEFAYNGETTSVSEDLSLASDFEWGLSSWNKYHQQQQEGYLHAVFDYAFTFPAAYDGLCLALSKSGVTEYSESWASKEETLSESDPFLDWLGDGRTPSDYYLLRVSDLLAQQA